ncbi:MAG: HlyD family efflux transporter periplasmic adaptor subunit [Pseudomonadota bacterium]
MERIIRSRPARIIFAAALVLFGVWGFWPYMFRDVANSAYVNAELTRISTPVAGVLSPAAPRSGAYITHDRRLELVAARTPDRSRLDDLEQQSAVADSTVALMEAQLSEISAADRKLRVRSDVYRTATLASLSSRTEAAEAEAAACDAARHEQMDRLDRTRRLAASGYATHAALRSAEDGLRAAEQTCKAAAAAIDGARVTAGAARGGVYLNDGANSASYEDQERDRLMLRRQDLEIQLVRARAAQAQLGGQLAQERTRYARAARFDALLPADHLVWNAQASPGAQVGEGQVLMDLADCRDRFVVVLMPARKIERMRVGDVAQVRLLGSGKWASGHVRRITGGAAREDQRLLAAAIPAPGPRMFSVEVGLDGHAAGDGRRSCDIGRPAEVRFDETLLTRSFAMLPGRSS